MRTLTIGELKAQFSEVIQAVQTGEEIAVAFGKKKEIIAYLIPKSARPTALKRRLGLLAGRGEVRFADDFKLTDNEFLGLS
jgi:antitoxin (DNA-binding transcriptional repressor) of toxin-antitoxin stability system